MTKAEFERRIQATKPGSKEEQEVYEALYRDTKRVVAKKRRAK